MNMSAVFPYRFRTYEPALFTEIYLPKRAKYQKILYDVLTTGFNFTLVKKHLKTRSRVIRNQINELLEDYPSLENFSIRRINQMEQVRWGYSMYEVDGVFFDYDEADRRRESGEEETKEKTKGLISEERTQVIRIIFRPRFEKVFVGVDSKEDQSAIKRAAFRSLLFGSRERESIKEETSSKNIKEVVDYIDKWTDDVSLFLFGYIVFHICSELKKLHDEEKFNIEEEIWITSFWNLQINRIQKI
jgi:hypothetical protein